MILWLFLAVALLNLLVGVLMALTWQWYSLPARAKPPRTPRMKKKKRKQEQQLTEAADAQTTDSAAQAEAEPLPPEPAEPTPLEECVPAQWLDILSKNAVEARSFLEATAQVLRLKIIAYRERLVEIDDQVRRLSGGEMNDDLPQLVVDLINLNGDWLSVQSEAMGALLDRHDSHSELEPIAAQLEDTLLEQNALIETSRLELETMQQDHSTETKKIVHEIGRMIDCSNRLRDLMQQSLSAILAVEARYTECDEQWQHDTLCHLANRTGIEVQIHARRGSEHARHSENSLVLLDIDQFRLLNTRYGTRLADQVLAELSLLLTGSLRRERGFDRLGRYSGQQFMALLGDTSVEQAFCAADRLRQTLEHAHFQCAEAVIPLSMTCAVVSLPAEEKLSTSLARLETTLAAAKAHGPNCTFLDLGTGAEFRKPLPYQGEAVHIEIDSKYLVPEWELETCEA